LRHRLVQGEVHDENALRSAAFPGMRRFQHGAGPAAFCQMLLNGGVYGAPENLRRATVAQLRRRNNFRRTRRWLAVQPKAIERATFFGAQLWAHRFTGTSIWIDPTATLCVLLTNRVHRRGRIRRSEGARRVT